MLRYVLTACAYLAWPPMSSAETQNLPQAVLDGMTQGFNYVAGGDVPRWETIPPRPVKECLEASGGVIDESVMRCRNGRQEYVKRNYKGERQVIQERPIPK